MGQTLERSFNAGVICERTLLNPIAADIEILIFLKKIEILKYILVSIAVASFLARSCATFSRVRQLQHFDNTVANSLCCNL